MSANTLDTTKYDDVTANTVNDAVLDASAILAWRQNVKAVVDQHATEIDGKLAKAGDTMTGNLTLSNGGATSPELRLNSTTKNLRMNNSGGVVRFIDQTTSTIRFSIDLTTAKLILNETVSINIGTGSPEGVVTAVVGSSYYRTDGAAGTTHYKKTTGTGNTGWTAS